MQALGLALQAQDLRVTQRCKQAERRVDEDAFRLGEARIGGEVRDRGLGRRADRRGRADEWGSVADCRSRASASSSGGGRCVVCVCCVLLCVCCQMLVLALLREKWYTHPSRSLMKPTWCAAGVAWKRESAVECSW